MSKKKEYPLDVLELREVDGGGILGFYSKGHHDPDEFRAAVLKEFDTDISKKTVRHIYHRCSIRGDGPDGWWISLEDYATPGRGRYPATEAQWL